MISFVSFRFVSLCSVLFFSSLSSFVSCVPFSPLLLLLLLFSSLPYELCMAISPVGLTPEFSERSICIILCCCISSQSLASCKICWLSLMSSLEGPEVASASGANSFAVKETGERAILLRPHPVNALQKGLFSTPDPCNSSPISCKYFKVSRENS